MATIKLRRGTAAQWITAATVLAVGEPGFETDTGKLKIGDGSTAWASLPYLTGDGSNFRGAYANLAALQAAVPSGNVGDYAYVDAGVASDVQLYIWDNDDTDWILSGGGIGGDPLIDATYADIATMLAAQGEQTQGLYYKVTDATGDNTILSGWAIYEKKAASTASISDYFKDRSQESLDPINFRSYVSTTSHGLIVGNVIKKGFVKVSDPDADIPIGIVDKVISVNEFTFVVPGGYVSNLSGLTDGLIYYVQSDGTLGTTATALPFLTAIGTTGGITISGAPVIGTVPDATESVKGKAEIATQAETDTGTDDVRLITPLKAATRYSKKNATRVGESFATIVLSESHLDTIIESTFVGAVDVQLSNLTSGFKCRIKRRAVGSLTFSGYSGLSAVGNIVVMENGDEATIYHEPINQWHLNVSYGIKSSYLPAITAYLGSSGVSASMRQATAVDKIPTTALAVGARITAIVTISGTQRKLYSAELVTPASSTANIEVSPSVIRPNDWNVSTNNKVWREIRSKGIVDVSEFGVIPSASLFVSDQINEIMTAAATGDTLIFPAGTYKIYAITVTKQLNFIGLGAKFQFSTVNVNHFTITVDLVTVKGFTFVGNGRSNVSYPLQGGIKITGCSNVLISDCLFDAMPYYGILTNSTHISDTSSDFGSINIVNCHIMRSKVGYYAEIRGEYVNFTGCSVVDCDTGLLIGAGNINVMGCNILDCSVVGIDLITGVNDAHGVITGCQINHNVLSIRGVDIVNGQFFRSNNIYYGDMEFTDCAAIEFEGCVLEGLEVQFDNCTGCKIQNCTIPGLGGTITLTTDWNGNQSDVFAYNNKNLSNKLIPTWNRSPLLSIYQATSTAAINNIISKVSLAVSEIMVVKGFVMGVRVDADPNDYTEAYYREFTSVFRRRPAGNIVKVGEVLSTAIADGAFGGDFQINANTTDQQFEVELIPDADDTLWTVQFAYTKSSLVGGLVV